MRASSFAGIAMTGLLFLAGAAPTEAQDVRVSLSWGSGDLRASAFYVSPGLRVAGSYQGYDRDVYYDDDVYYDRGVRYGPRAPRRVVRRHYAECVAEGPYLYCWDAPRYRYQRPVVYVYVTDHRVARRHHPRGRGWERQWARHHHRVAARYWRRWADARRYRYDRDHFDVDLQFAW